MRVYFFVYVHEVTTDIIHVNVSWSSDTSLG